MPFEQPYVTVPPSDFLALSTRPPDSARDDLLVACMQNLLDGLPPGAAGAATAHLVAQDLIGCFDANGRRLDLARLPAPLRAVVWRLAPDGWAALHEMARARETRIESVVFPVEAHAMDHVFVGRGLNQLSDLRTVQLPAPQGAQEIDLSSLESEARELVVCVEGARAGLTVRAALGLTVRRLIEAAASTAQAASGVPARAGGHEGQGRQEDGPRPQAPTLSHAGTARSGTAAQPRLPPSAGQPRDREPAGPTLPQLVGQGRLRAAPRAQDEQIVAMRRLTMQWLSDRALHHRIKLESKTFMQDSGRGLAPKATGGQVGGDPMFAYEQMRQQCAHTVYDARQFGNLIRAEFAGMRVDEVRHFAVGTDRRLLGLEVAVKQVRQGSEVRTEYVVSVYDPANPGAHKRVAAESPEWFAGKPIGAWGDFAAVFQTERQMGVVHRWPPAGVREAIAAKITGGPDVFVGSEHLASTELLRHAMRDGFARGVTAFCRAAFTIDASAQGACQRLLRGESGSGLWRAMQMGRTESVERWLEAVLHAPRDAFSAEHRFVLVGSDASERPSRAAHPLAAAMINGHYPTVSAYVRAIVAAPPGTLSLEHKRRLLAAADALGRPALHVLAEQPPPVRTGALPDEQLVLRQHRAIFRFVHAVASSSLTEQDKRRLCAANHPDDGVMRFLRRATAAQLALRANRNPGAAGAMVCAILESGNTPQETADLLEQLGVRVEDVMTALAAMGTPGRAWLSQILRSLPLSGLRAADIDRLRTRFASQRDDGAAGMAMDVLI